MRIGILSNPRAGGGGSRASNVLEHVRKYPEVIHLVPDDKNDVRGAIREMAKAGIGVLVVNGGDGTLQHALTEMLRPESPFLERGEPGDLPLVAPLRSGRTNMTAYDIGSRRDPIEAVDRLVSRVRSGQLRSHIVHRAALRMKLEPDGVDHWGTFFGVGVIYRGTLIVKRVFPNGKAQGAFGSTVVTAGLIARALTGRSQVVRTEDDDPLRADPISVRADGEDLEPAGFQLLLATTLHRLIGGMRPFWARGPGGIRFTTLRPGCLHQPSQLARVLTGRVPRDADLPGSMYMSRNVEDLELTLDCGITLDGEMFRPRAGRHAFLSADHRVRFVSTR